MDSINVIILAAGAGLRLGGPKLFQRYSGKYFIEYIYESLKLAGFEHIVTVIPPNSEYKLSKIPLKLKTVVNPKPERGMLSSLYEGLHSQPCFSGTLIIPVDHPFIKADTYKQLGKLFLENPESIIKVRYKSRPAHPLIIPKKLYELIPQDDIPGGLQYLIKSSSLPVSYLDTTDEGTILNLNTPEDLET